VVVKASTPRQLSDNKVTGIPSKIPLVVVKASSPKQ
jgi:hypothetical protein